jgi:hypothetical protein
MMRERIKMSGIGHKGRALRAGMPHAHHRARASKSLHQCRRHHRSINIVIFTSSSSSTGRTGTSVPRRLLYAYHAAPEINARSIRPPSIRHLAITITIAITIHHHHHHKH